MTATASFASSRGHFKGTPHERSTREPKLTDRGEPDEIQLIAARPVAAVAQSQSGQAPGALTAANGIDRRRSAAVTLLRPPLRNSGSYAHGIHLAKGENTRRYNTALDGCGYRDSGRASAHGHRRRPGSGMAMQPHSVRGQLFSFRSMMR